MLIIPELETVVILVPRAGSTSLKRAVLRQYPEAMMLYRHMEADGVPHGYNRWRRIGFVRHPVDRLWSLYKYLSTFDGPHNRAYIESMQRSVEMDFSEWVVSNKVVFTQPYDTEGHGRYYPKYAVNHPLPENEKSQFVYLRPDLGTEIWQFDDLQGRAWSELSVMVGHENGPCQPPRPPLSLAAMDHINRFFKWDLLQVAEES